MSRSSRILRRACAVALAVPLLAGSAIGAAQAAPTSGDSGTRLIFQAPAPAPGGGFGKGDERRSGGGPRSGTVETNSPSDWLCQMMPWLPPCKRNVDR